MCQVDISIQISIQSQTFRVVLSWKLGGNENLFSYCFILLSARGSLKKERTCREKRDHLQDGSPSFYHFHPIPIWYWQPSRSKLLPYLWIEPFLALPCYWRGNRRTNCSLWLWSFFALPLSKRNTNKKAEVNYRCR